jgi:DNA topoisomerase-1
MLYRLADTREGISSIRVQSAAQKLYEGFGKGGLISYPRTDSSRFSASFVSKSKEYIINKFGSEYFDPAIKVSAGAQDAHEAIRPTSLNLLPIVAKDKYNLDSDQFKVYSLIYFHTLKCLMTQPIRLNIQYKLENHGHEFRATTFKIQFQGYYIATKAPTPKIVPNFNKGDQVPVLEYIKEANQTMPPARYTEGMLIDKLDNIGVGRPSTFSTTIKNNKDRLYLLKEGKSLVPTNFGKKIIGKLINFFPKIMTYEYTANIEKELDKISEGKRDYKEILTSFYEKFEKDVDSAYETMEFEKLKPESIGEKCPDCSEELINRVSRRGDRFIACSGFPKCTYTRSIPNANRK